MCIITRNLLLIISLTCAPYISSQLLDFDEDVNPGKTCELPDGNDGTCQFEENCDLKSTLTIPKWKNEWNICCNSKNYNLLCCKTKKTKHIEECNIYIDIKEQIGKYRYWKHFIDATLNFDPNPCTESKSSVRRKRNVSSLPKSSLDWLFGKSLPIEFSHMALLGFGNANNITWYCGGILINEQYVLTAAHCVYQEGIGQVTYVRLGQLYLNESSSRITPTVYSISKIIKHPDYKAPVLYNDIALLKLRDNVDFTNEILPACINENPSVKDIQLQTIGWGATEYGGEMSSKLMKVNLDVYSYEECYSFYNKSLDQRILPQGINATTQICAGSRNEKDSCTGDSGGPLQYKKYGVFHVVGITSFGKACGIFSAPGVYTKVAAYSSWIESVIWK